jgi:hypothetical protein
MHGAHLTGRDIHRLKERMENDIPSKWNPKTSRHNYTYI